MTALAIANAVGAVLAAFLALRMWLLPAEQRAAAATFGLFTFVAAVFLGEVALLAGVGFDVRWWHDLTNLCVPAIAPAFYLYARAVTEPEYRWRPAQLGHFAVSFFFLGLQLLAWAMPAEGGEPAAGHVDRRAELLLLGLVDANLLVYATLAFRRIWKHRRELSERAQEGWTHPLRGLPAFAGFLWLVIFLSAVGDFTAWPLFGSMIGGAGGVFAIFVVLWNLTLPSRLTAGEVPQTLPPMAEENQAESRSDEGVADARSSPLKPEEAVRLGEKLRRSLETERLFLDASLSLQGLAERLDTTRHKLSPAFRKTYGGTFHQVIGRFRVRHAAELLRSGEGKVQTIAAIASASGFNTLSAFNAAFRSEFGMAPSEYRRRVEDSQLAPAKH